MNRPVHFEILADDPDKIAAFYREVLSWEIEREGPVAYWLVTTGPEDARGINGAIMHRAFPQALINTVAVESLQETLMKVKQAGGKLVTARMRSLGLACTLTVPTPRATCSGSWSPCRRWPRVSSGDPGS